MKTIRITLTSEEKQALSNYPNLMALPYIWVGILALRGIMPPETLSELSVQYLCDDTYEVKVPDYSLAG